MTNEYAIKILEQRKCCRECVADCTCDECDEAFDMAINALKSLDKLDEIITEQIDISNNQVECQTLRWVLDKMSEMSEEEE